MTERRIKVNKARCRKCDTVIESKHRHDWVQCPCTAIFVDGGHAYLRRGAKNFADLEELSEYYAEGEEPAFDPKIDYL